MRWDGRVEAKDDAGKAVVLLTGGAMFNDPRMADPAFERLCARITQINVVGRRKMLVGITSLAIVLPTPVFLWVGGINAPVASVAFIIFVFCASYGASVLSGRLGDNFSGQLVSTMLAGGVCPSCTYSLVGIEPINGGLLECPECGASWDADKITHARHYRTAARQGESRGNLRKALRTPPVTSIKDDRGIVYPLVSRKLRLESATAVDDRHQGQLAEIRTTLRHLGRWHRIGAASAILFFPIGLGFMPSAFVALTQSAAMAAAAPNSAIFFPGTLAFMPMSALFAVSTLRGEFGVKPTQIRRIMSVHKLCPSCACDLKDIEAEQDGCTVCPECGAAWELPREIL